MTIETFGFDSTAEDVTEGLDLSGKTYLVTGANSGLGLETVRVLAARGGRVLALARSEEKAAEALASANANGAAIACELSDPASVRASAAAVLEHGVAIDAIICNAGVMALPEARTTLGLDLQFLTNHVGHFMLVTGTLEALAKDGRVVVVSSGAHHMAPKDGIEFDNLDGQRDFDPWKMYGQSKLANILFTRELSRRFEGTSRTANTLHPGVIRTNLTRHMDDAEAVLKSATLKTIPQGAATQTLLATHPALAEVSGVYYADCQPKKTSANAQRDDLRDQLWAKTEELIAAF